MMWIVILGLLLFVSVVINAVLLRRLLQFDSFVSYIASDAGAFSKALGDVTSQHLTSNAPEVLGAHRLLKEMQERMSHYAETVNKWKLNDAIKQQKPSTKKPVVID